MTKPITDWDSFRKQFLKNNLRRISWKWPATRQVVVAARTERKLNPATGKLCWHVRCADCKQEFLEKEIEVDHVNPVVNVQGMQDTLGSARSAIDTGTFVLNLLPRPDGLQVLCRSCHALKTDRENTIRRAYRRVTKRYQGMLKNLADSERKPRPRPRRKEE